MKRDKITDKKVSIWLIEDDDIEIYIFKTLLDKCQNVGNVKVFKNGRSPIDYIETEPSDVLPSLIILDINMPILNGWGFLNQFKSLNKKGNTRTEIVMASSSIASFDIEKAERNELVSKLIQKPVSLNMLRDIVNGTHRQLNARINSTT